MGQVVGLLVLGFGETKSQVRSVQGIPRPCPGSNCFIPEYPRQRRRFAGCSAFSLSPPLGNQLPYLPWLIVILWVVARCDMRRGVREVEISFLAVLFRGITWWVGLGGSGL